MAETASGLGCSITIAGRRKGDCCKSSDIPFRTRRFRMIFRKGFLFYKFFNIRLLFYLLFKKSDLLVANDLDTLLPNYIVSRLKGIPLIYDSHEYFTGVPEVMNRPFVKWTWKQIERAIVPRLKYMITVSDSIANLYREEYNIIPVTVRNCSRRSDKIKPYSRKELGIPEDALLLILQGTGINIDRGAGELVDALELCGNAFLLIVGSGDVVPALKKKVEEQELDRRVRFISRVTWDELMRYTRAADIGISLDKDTNLNYRFSMPNKIFDYFSAGIPVLAGALPEVTKLITGFTSGIVLNEITPQAIAKALNILDSNREMLKYLKNNAIESSGFLTWDEESKKAEEIFKAALNKL